MSDLTRRGFSAALAAAAAPLNAQKPPDNGKPNIVFFVSDQHDGRVMGCNGHPVVRTPNMDRLASMGVLFRNTYPGSAVCCPSRASLMTGRFPSDVGCYCNATAFDGRYPTWGKRLQQAGYYTWATGKLDLCPDKDLGFVQFDTEHGNFIEPDTTSLFRRPVGYRTGLAQHIKGGPRKKVHKDGRRVQSALNWLETQPQKMQQPWVMYCGIEQPKAWESGALQQFMEWYPPEKMPLPNIPPGHLENMHIAYRVMRSFSDIAFPIPDERVREARAAYYARVSEVDAHLGAMLNMVEKTGHLKDTIFVYTSDHGEMLGEHGLWFKNELLEAASRVPLIIAGPGIPRGRVVETPVAHVDLVAALLDWGGAEIARELRGHSLRPLAMGVSGNHPGWAMTQANSQGCCTGSYMVRKGDWKYIYFSWYDNLLFNLRNDPDELNNLAGQPQYASIEKELHTILTSQLDPDAVTREAFREQDRRLQHLVKTQTAKEFYEYSAERFGKGEAAVLTDRFYRS
ncbi:MAG TPA: sulfatase-like hydrolase/transferase [Bryobacteraceae bacterium]|nr:sulfatase-like hydrolase/transferase [Bryobacteraceae bacterium]